MDLVTGIGFIAAICTTLSFIPQAMKVFNTKHTQDISLMMYIILSTGVALWAIYGIFTHSWPIIAANTVTFILSLAILVMKLIYKQ